MTIDEVKRFLELLSQKTQSGGFTVPQFNLAADRAQMQLFERDYRIWQQSDDLTEAVGTFTEDNVPFAVPSTGIVTYPSNWVHTIEVRRYYAEKATQIPCTEVKASDIGEVLISSLSPPTLRFPKYVEYDDHWQFYPKNVGSVIIDYLRRPRTPVWAYTIVNNAQVYDSANSVQLEWPDFAHNEIAGIMCGYLGIQIREGLLIEFAQQFKAENAQS